MLVAIGSSAVAGDSLEIPRAEWSALRAQRDALPTGADAACPSDPDRSALPERIAHGALRAYRAILSSQDARHCQFYPSCSHYAEDAIRSRGTLLGTLMASDRLQRCNPRAYNYYPLDERRMRLHDPVPVPGREPVYDPFTMPAPRSRGVAMALSAAVPGAGQVYAGRAWDGVYSLIQVGAPAIFACLNYRRDGAGSIRGTANAALALGFYAGCIYGAGESAAHRRVGGDRGMLVVNRKRSETRSAPAGAADYAAAARLWAQGETERAAESFGEIRRRGPPGLASRAAFFEALSSSELGRWAEAQDALGSFLEHCPEPANRILVLESLAFLDRRQAERKRDERQARILSAIVPGAGQLRAGRPGKAAASFAVTTLLGLYAYRTTRTESWGEFAILALPTFWRYYRGNILSAGRLAAARHDREDAEELRRRLGLR